MRGRLFIIIFLCGIAGSLFGQTELHSRSKKAIAFFREAQKLDHVGNWYRSLDLLKQALNKDDSFDEAILLTYQTFVKRGEYTRADSVFSKLQTKVEPRFKNRMLLDGAFYHFSQGKYEKAQALKDQIEGPVENIDSGLYDQVLGSIDFSVKEKPRARDIAFEKLEAPLNAQPQQYFPSITGSDMLVFTVREKAGRGDENIFVSQWNGEGWEKPQPISATINTDRNEGTASISADGRTLVFTGCNKPGGIGGCDLYISYKAEGAWSRPQLLNRNVNSLYWESQPSLSQDGRQLYFVSKRPEGMGGQDIWWSKKVMGQWQPAVNLGPTVNTRFDDCSPYIHPNGKTMFYASRGMPGFGGYDLFRTERLNDTDWEVPANLGYPINNHEDQVGYTISADGWAYYSYHSSDRQAKLYRFKMPEDLLPEAPLYNLTGLVTDASDGKPLTSEVIVADVSSDSTLLVTRSNADEGLFRLLMEPNKEAYLYIKKKGYLLFRAGIADLYANGNTTEVRLQPLKPGEKVILKNILFEFNSSSLDVKATKELDLAAAFILDNDEVMVEIAGHTDDQGDEGYNLKLSESRAASVYKYFLKKGVPKENLVFAGYGESKPIAEGAGANVAAQNRRIELVIKSVKK